jgi:hypothetical protein
MHARDAGHPGQHVRHSRTGHSRGTRTTNRDTHGDHAHEIEVGSPHAQVEQQPLPNIAVLPQRVEFAPPVAAFAGVVASAVVLKPLSGAAVERPARGPPLAL